MSDYSFHVIGIGPAKVDGMLMAVYTITCDDESNVILLLTQVCKNQPGRFVYMCHLLRTCHQSFAHVRKKWLSLAY